MFSVDTTIKSVWSCFMAKRVSLKKDLAKKLVDDQSNRRSPARIDATVDGILERAAAREHFPSVKYINSYQVKVREQVGVCIIDLTDLVDKYPRNTTLIEQLIVGLNAITIPGKSESILRTNAEGIRRFIEFLNSIRNLSNMYVVNIADINMTVAQSFSSYLLCVYPKEGRRSKWYNIIRRIVERLQELYPINPLVINSFPWPASPKQIKSTKQGYLPREMNELIESCKSDIKDIKCFHERYKMLDQELLLDEWNIENLMYFFEEHLKRPYYAKCSTKVGINKLIYNYPNAQECMDKYGYKEEEIRDLYVEKGSELALCGRSPFGTRISQNPNKERALLQFNLALATLKKRLPLFPYYYPIDDAKNLLSYNFNSNKDPLCKLFSKAINFSSNRIEVMKNGYLRTQAVHAARHFVSDTIYPFLLLCLINTGWNLESLFSISDDVDEYTTPDLIDPQNYVIIIGLKNRGQKEKPKLVFHRSPKNNILSTYSLLKYIESIVTQYKDSPYYKKGYLWQFTIDNYTKDKIITTFNESYRMTAISRRFIQRHGFEYISDTSIDHPKIRSGYVALRQLMGSTERKLSQDLGHNDDETIIHYISDESSNMVQDIRIKELQKHFINDLTNFKVRIVESQSLQDLRNAINAAQTQHEKGKLIKEQANMLGFAEKTIVHLLDIGSRKYILACENAKKPSWPGADEYVKEGQNCRYFNKCALCTQAIVFPEYLPYIARRIMDLEKLQLRLSSADWILQYGDEFDAWKQILDCWNNQEQIKDAWGQARAGIAVLPQIMRGGALA